MFGLLGPNGAGKSSLTRTNATLQLPDSGTIRFADIDVIANRERRGKCSVISRKSLDSTRPFRPRWCSITSHAEGSVRFE